MGGGILSPVFLSLSGYNTILTVVPIPENSFHVEIFFFHNDYGGEASSWKGNITACMVYTLGSLLNQFVKVTRGEVVHSGATRMKSQQLIWDSHGEFHFLSF